MNACANPLKVAMSEFKLFEMFVRCVAMCEKSSQKKPISPFFS
jgi:hypothetical protein